MAAGGLGYARSVCRGSPVLCHSLDENLRLIPKPGLAGRSVNGAQRMLCSRSAASASAPFRSLAVDTCSAQLGENLPHCGKDEGMVHSEIDAPGRNPTILTTRMRRSFTVSPET